MLADPPAKVTDRIYIGSLQSACDDNNSDINAVINLSGKTYKSKKPVLCINMHDSVVEHGQLDTYMRKFAIGVAAIETALDEGRTILVHCAAGINRSATLICFYLIEHGWTYEDAYTALLAANRIRDVPLLTNPSFVYMLKAHSAMKFTLESRKRLFDETVRVIKK